MEAVTQNEQREGVIDTYLKRSKEGVRVTVKTDPEVEEFIRNMSNGVMEGVRVLGREWSIPGQPQTPPTAQFNLDGSPAVPEPLRVYTFPWGENSDELIHPCTMNLQGAGKALRLQNGRANLNFLRLVGTSRPEGVTFIWNALLSREELERLHEQLTRGQERFYTEYLRPVDLKVSLVLSKN